MSHALLQAPSEIDETEGGPVPAEIMRFHRYWAVEDIQRGGADMREVTAYAAVFEQDSEIQDQHGHYIEVIDRSAFRRTLSHPGNVERCQFLWNHGYNVDGTPSAIASVPIGRLLEVKADGRGLLTRAKFNKSDLAEHVLEAIKNQDVKGYSFRGRVFKSDPMRVPRIQRGGALPRVRRIELGLSDLGPTGVPWYTGSQIVAVRSQVLAEAQQLPYRERIEIARALLDPADEPPQPTDLSDSPEPEDTTEPETSEVDTPDEGDTETSPTPADESTPDTEVEDPEDDSPTDSDESLGTEDPDEADQADAPLPPVSQAARSMSAADVARKARVALILRTTEGR